MIVRRSQAVGLADLYAVIQDGARTQRDATLRGMLEGILFRLNPLVQGAAARQYAAGVDAIDINAITPGQWGVAVLEGGSFLDDFSKAFLLGWAAWHLYTDAVMQRKERGITEEARIQIIFEEANSVDRGQRARSCYSLLPAPDSLPTWSRSTSSRWRCSCRSRGRTRSSRGWGGSREDQAVMEGMATDSSGDDRDWAGAFLWLCGGGAGEPRARGDGGPALDAAGAGALAFLLARSFLQNRCTQARVRIEQELPSFVSEIAGQLMVTSSARLVLEEVITGMRYASSLRAWMQYLLYGYNREGVIFLGQARREAQAITPHLGVVMYELERLAETGGGDFAAAFTTSADELSAILEARAVAGSKAESARMAVLMLMGIMGFVLFTMFSSDAIREGFNYPAVQMITVGCVVVMGFGYSFMNDMINEAMEG